MGRVSHQILADCLSRYCKLKKEVFCSWQQLFAAGETGFAWFYNTFEQSCFTLWSRKRFYVYLCVQVGTILLGSSQPNSLYITKRPLEICILATCHEEEKLKMEFPWGWWKSGGSALPCEGKWQNPSKTEHCPRIWGKKPRGVKGPVSHLHPSRAPLVKGPEITSLQLSFFPWLHQFHPCWGRRGLTKACVLAWSSHHEFWLSCPVSHWAAHLKGLAKIFPSI